MGKTFATWLVAVMAAGAPTTPGEVVKSALLRITAALSEARSAGPLEAERARVELRRVGTALFDLDDMARRTFSSGGTDLRPADQAELTQILVDLLHRSYGSRLEPRSGARIVHAPAILAGTRATVKSKVRTGRATDLTLEHRLHLKGNRWKIYDVLVDGVSMVSTWRHEFERAIATSSYPAAIDTLRSPYRGGRR